MLISRLTRFLPCKEAEKTPRTTYCYTPPAEYPPDSWQAKLPPWQLKLDPGMRKAMAAFEKTGQDEVVGFTLTTRQDFSRRFMKPALRRELMRDLEAKGVGGRVPVLPNMLYGEAKLSRIRVIAETEALLYVEKVRRLTPLAVMAVRPYLDWESVSTR